MMSEFWATTRTQDLTSAGVMAVLAGLVCFYAAKYELCRLGRNPGQGWWPPRQWAIVQVWSAIRAAEAGRPMLLWWGIMMWIFFVTSLILLPLVVYVAYLSLRS